MSTWWEALVVFEKVLWVIAVPATILTVLQVLLEIFGVGDHGDTDADVSGIGDADVLVDADGDAGGHDHGGGMKIFTIKGAIIFFTAFAWIGLACFNAGLAAILASLIGAVTGVAFMFLFAWIFYTLNRLGEDGSLLLRNALYQTGECYLRVPGHRAGPGKVSVVVQGQLRELSAVTDGEEIPTGAKIQVLDLVDAETVLVGLDS